MSLKLYTRTGDKGDTYCMALGRRVRKDHPLLELLGTLDEANSFIGLARSLLPGDEGVASDLKWIQGLLFRIGFTISGGSHLSEDDVSRLEEITDRYFEGVELRHFILPHGPPPASALHVARAVVRRAERRLITTLREVEVGRGDLILRALNRASDALFAIAVRLTIDSGHKLEPALEIKE